MEEMLKVAAREAQEALQGALDRLTETAVRGMFNGNEDDKRQMYEAYALIETASDRVSWMLQGAELRAPLDPRLQVWRSGEIVVVASCQEEATELLRASPKYTAEEAERWVKDRPWKLLSDDEAVKVAGDVHTVKRVRQMAAQPMILEAE